MTILIPLLMVGLLVASIVIIMMLVALMKRRVAETAALPEDLHQTEARLNQRFGELATLSNAMNARQREEMQTTLRSRFEEGFKIVETRLNEVRTGLREVDKLSGNVAQFNQLLGNVKSRGTWGEVQLGAILEDLLSPTQYERNAHPNPRSALRVVEYAIRLPGEGDTPILLPVDSKFPREDYERLIVAVQTQDVDAEAHAVKKLLQRIQSDAMSIRDKYICPPYTTDFGILFLPTEGLYSEVIKHADWMSAIQRDYRVLIAGPMTLSALINALQMGFRTLAIQKKSAEVWQLLAKVKGDLVSYGSELEKLERNLNVSLSAVNTASARLTQLNKKLKNVEIINGDSAVGEEVNA